MNKEIEKKIAFIGSVDTKELINYIESKFNEPVDVIVIDSNDNEITNKDMPIEILRPYRYENIEVKRKYKPKGHERPYKFHP